MATSGDDRPQAKRRKTALACEECRERKRKCDGARPICGACGKRPRSTACVFENERSRKGWNKSYIDSLLGRIRQLENAQDAIGDSHRPSTTIKVASTDQEPQPSFNNEARQSLPVSQDEDEFVFDDQSNNEFPEEARNGNDTSMQHQAPPIRDMDGTSAFSTLRHRGGSQQPMTSGIKSPDNTERPLFPAPRASEVEETRDDGSEDDRENGEHEVDAMGSKFGNLNEVGSGTRQQSTAYFGPSSAVTFMSQVQNAIAKIGVSPASIEREDKSGNPQTRGNSTLEENRAPWSDLNIWEFSIPPREQADALVETYWNSVDCLYPFLHKSTFTSKYLRIWQPADQGLARPGQQVSYDRRPAEISPRDKLFYCTLNAVFALACHFHAPIPFRDRASTSEIFFNRAKKLLSFDMMELGSIQLVQTLLLVGQYLQSTAMVGSCWNIVGLAIRVAQGIGLHLPSRYAGTNQLQTELKRRIWGGCILLDRVLSMTYGRPFMIDPVTSRNMILPSVIDDEYLSTSPGNLKNESERSPSRMAFYVHALKLTEILGQILAALYHGTHDQLADGYRSDDRSGSGTDFLEAPSLTEKIKAGDFQSLLALDSSLTKWQNGLPHYLRVQQGQIDETFGNFNTLETTTRSTTKPIRSLIFNRQANVLQARYLHIRILLLRPMLLALFQYDQGPSDDNLDDGSMNAILHRSMLTKISNLCISTAQDLVDLIITGWVAAGTEALPAWWYNVFYIYTSALVILTARLCPSIEGWNDGRSLVESWKKCLKFLQEFQVFSRSASKCYRVLQIIDAQFAFAEQPHHDNEVNTRFDPTYPRSNHTPASHEIGTGATAAVENSYSMRADAPSGRNIDSQLPGADFSVPDHNLEKNTWMRDMLDMDWLTSMNFPGMDDAANVNAGFEW